MTEFKKIVTYEELKEALSIRQEAFVVEKGVPEKLERDEYDTLDREALHFALYDDGLMVGTLRVIRGAEEGERKLQRIAVRKELRGMGYGRTMLLETEKALQSSGIMKVHIGAQVDAIGFYQRLGYKITGEEYIEAGLRHFPVEKTLLDS